MWMMAALAGGLAGACVWVVVVLLLAPVALVEDIDFEEHANDALIVGNEYTDAEIWAGIYGADAS